MTGADGRYRVEVPDGLYELSGEALIEFEGQTYRLGLEPVDGACDALMSEDGIVKDFVLLLEGLRSCPETLDPQNDGSYYGAAVHLSPTGLATTQPPDALIDVTFNPENLLADGSEGEAFTMRRTIASLTAGLVDLDDSGSLHDIPLGRYSITASLTHGGTSLPLLVWTEDMAEAAPVAELGFEAAQFYPYGIREQWLTLVVPDGLG